MSFRTKYFLLLFFYIVFLFHFSACDGLKSKKNFELPEGFILRDHDEENEEILCVDYKNEMQITVSKNMSNTIKRSAFYGSAIMKQNFEIKFPIILQKFKGKNPSKQAHYFVNDNIYLHRSFDFVVDGTPAYYEYGAFHIENPEEYYELFISGDKTLQEEHQHVIKNFLKGIK